MAARGRDALERLDRLVEPREDVRLAIGTDPRDGALEILDVAEGLGPHHPVGGLVECDDAELVAIGEGRGRPQDRLLADVDLLDATHAGTTTATLVERVAVAGGHRTRLVDDDDECDVRLLLAIAHAHVDGQRLLDRRLLVPARAVALGTADHHQPPAQVAHVDLERPQLAVGEPQPRDIDEDDAVVRGQAGEVGRQRLRNDRIHELPLALERRDELRRHGVVAGEDQGSRLALDDRVRVGAVVLAERVARGLDHGAERVEAGLGRRHVERHRG